MFENTYIHGMEKYRQIDKLQPQTRFAGYTSISHSNFIFNFTPVRSFIATRSEPFLSASADVRRMIQVSCGGYAGGGNVGASHRRRHPRPGRMEIADVTAVVGHAAPGLIAHVTSSQPQPTLFVPRSDSDPATHREESCSLYVQIVIARKLLFTS